MFTILSIDYLLPLDFGYGEPSLLLKDLIVAGDLGDSDLYDILFKIETVGKV